MLRSIFGLSLVVSLISTSFACDIHGQSGFAPKNDMYIGVEDKAAGAMTEQEFSSTMDKVAAIYSPIVSSKGGILTMQKFWSS
jgi:hypothetical protein